MGHRAYLGAGVSTTDNGRALDINAVLGIKDKRHPLNHRHDPYRYSLENPEYRAFVEYIVENGPPPQPAMFRRGGLLLSSDLVYRYLKKAYPAKVAQHPEQPFLQLVYGNRRFYGLHDAEQEWAKRGGSKWQGSNLLAVYMQVSDEQMEAEFVLENSNRTRASIYEDQLTVRAELAKNKSWDDIAALLKQPKQELLRLHRPLVEAHLAIVQSFSAGAISRTKAVRIAQTIAEPKDQPAALEDDTRIPARPAKQQMIKAADVPREDIAALINHAKYPKGNIDTKPHIEAVTAWLTALPEVSR